MNKDPIIGIDLGTTHSCIAVFRNGAAEIITNDHGNRTTASYVSFQDGECLIGDVAKNQVVIDPSKTVFHVKRLIGRRFDDLVQADTKQWPFNVINNGGRPKIELEFNGEIKEYSPEEISSMVLLEMKKTAEAHLGQKISHAVLTVPDCFNDTQRRATKNVAEISGLNVLGLVGESTAAAIAYASDNEVSNDRNVLIFDLGSGTLDVTIITIKGNHFDMRSTSGETHLGGVDFDRMLVNQCVQEFMIMHDRNISNNQESMVKLRTACEEAKKTLSGSNKANIDIESLFEGIDFHTTITRATFEDLCNDLFERTLDPVQRCLNYAGMNPLDIQDVVLVGGSSYIPRIQDLLSNFFHGMELNKPINPDEIVARGAAYYAAMRTGKSGFFNVFVTERIPHSISVEVEGYEREKIYEIFSIGAEVTRDYTTSSDDQSDLKIKVYEGNHMANDNLLGIFNLGGIQPFDEGIPKLQVKYKFDSDRIFNMDVKDKSPLYVYSMDYNRITITDDRGMFSKEEITKMGGYNLPGRVIAMNTLRNYCLSMKSIVEDNFSAGIISKSDMMLVLLKCNWTIKWLEEDLSSKKETFERKQRTLEVAFRSVMAKIHQAAGGFPGGAG